MQVGIDVYMHVYINFGGHGTLRFRRYCYSQKQPNFPFWPWTIVHGHQKINRSESAQKIHASRDWCHMHVHQFWWAWPLQFRRYCYLSKMAKFPFLTMDYSPWSSKNLIDRNWLKKFMQVGIDVTCMYTNFGGCSLSGFGDTGYSQKWPEFPFLTMDYSPWSSKNLIDSESALKNSCK